MRFYGREEELQMLRGQTQLAIKHRTARMAVVTGRRRVGKTSLIEEAFGAANMQAATGGVAVTSTFSPRRMPCKKRRCSVFTQRKLVPGGRAHGD